MPTYRKMARTQYDSRYERDAKENQHGQQESGHDQLGMVLKRRNLATLRDSSFRTRRLLPAVVELQPAVQAMIQPSSEEPLDGAPGRL
jgi:hypothetical protein